MRFALVIPLCSRSSKNALPLKSDGTLPPRSPSSLKNLWESKGSAAVAAAAVRKPAMPAAMTPFVVLFMMRSPCLYACRKTASDRSDFLARADWRAEGSPGIRASPLIERGNTGERGRCQSSRPICGFSPMPGEFHTGAPGHRRRSPAPGSHRTWRADFPHHALRQSIYSTASACISRYGRRSLGRSSGVRCLIWWKAAQVRCSPAQLRLRSIHVPVTLHGPVHLEQRADVSADAVIGIVAAQGSVDIADLVADPMMPDSPHQLLQRREAAP